MVIRLPQCMMISTPRLSGGSKLNNSTCGVKKQNRAPLLWTCLFSIFSPFFFRFFVIFTSMYVVVEYLQQQYREHSTAQYSTAQGNHPCTKQQTKYVPIRIHIKTSIYAHACGVQFVFLEHGALC